MENDILKAGEDYLIEKYGTDAPYEKLLAEFAKEHSPENFDHQFRELCPLLVKLHWILYRDNYHCAHYFSEVRISNNGQLYITFNIQEDSFLASLQESPEPHLKAYSESAMDCGDICPTLVAGTILWNVTKDSSAKHRILFLLHLAFTANKYCNTIK